MTTPTNYVIRQQLRNISNRSSARVSRANSAVNANASAETADNQETKIEITNRKFRKLGNYCTEIIFYDNTRATILHPMPCMKWTSPLAPDENGDVELTDELEATVLTVGDTSVVLGFPGNICGLSRQLELLIDLGDTELLMNNEFYSVKAKHHARDGVEI
jgi:hypothetical protein